MNTPTEPPPSTSHTTAEPSAGSHAATGYERADVKVRAVVLLVVAVGLVIAATQIGLWQWLRVLRSSAQRRDPQLSSVIDTSGKPPPPRLETMPGEELQRLLKTQATRLESYGWTDKSTRAVHIPVSRAIDLIVERGLPPTGNTSAAPNKPATETQADPAK